MHLKFLCDENISNAILTSLEKRGFDIKKVKLGLPDSEVALQAKKEKRIILTFDSDFSNILEYPPKSYSGIIRLKIHPPFNDLVIKAFHNLFSKFNKPEDFKRKLFILEKNSFRIYEENKNLSD